MRKAILPLALALSVFDPMVACEEPERDFEYGAAEMRAAIEGTWMVVVQRPNGPAEHYTIVMREAGVSQEHAERTVVRSASACTNRSFVREAGACYDSSMMRLEVKVASGEQASGHFEVVGTTFVGGVLDLGLGDLDVHAVVERYGIAYSASFDEAVVTLVRART